MSKIEWDGQGLPPVGTVCEVENEVLGGWDAVDSILAHCVVLGSHVAVFQIKSRIAYAKAESFRPLRTHEQIAAEEREKAVAAMVAIMCKDGAFDADDPECTFAMEKLHDAGYRKVEP